MNFTKGQKVIFSKEVYTFISYYKYQETNDFCIIFDGKERHMQPTQFVEAV